MGFHKRHLTEDFIISAYKNGGINEVVYLITKPDALLYDSNCKICSEVIDAIAENNLQKVESILVTKIKNHD